MPPRPIVLDTDIGSDVDDALALGLVLASPDELDLRAVTTVSSDTRARARIASALLALAGRGDVPVYAGERTPLLRPGPFNWFGHEESCVAPGVPAPVAEGDAPHRLVELARAVPGLEIVLIGPLTNLARALAIDPELPSHVGGITVMGGHVREAKIGDFTCAPGVDYNLCSDPEATVAVLGAGFRARLVTADVTLATWLRRADLERLASAGAAARELARQVGFWEPLQRRIFTGMGGTVADDNVAFLHDPLTVWALVDPAPLRFERLRIVPTIERGVLRTLEVDAGLGIGAEMEVATAVDARAAGSAIAERLARL